VKTRLRGLRDIPSITRLGGAGQRHARHEYEILNELTQLGREKVWLKKNVKNWQERLARLHERLGDIEKREVELKQQVAVSGKIALDVQGVEEIADKEGREVIIKY